MMLACPGSQPDQSTEVTAVQPHRDASAAQLSVYGGLLLRDSGAFETLCRQPRPAPLGIYRKSRAYRCPWPFGDGNQQSS